MNLFHFIILIKLFWRIARSKKKRDKMTIKSYSFTFIFLILKTKESCKSFRIFYQIYTDTSFKMSTTVSRGQFWWHWPSQELHPRLWWLCCRRTSSCKSPWSWNCSHSRGIHCRRTGSNRSLSRCSTILVVGGHILILDYRLSMVACRNLEGNRL